MPQPRRQVLFTGFEPFGGIAENPSWEVASAAAEVFGPEGAARRLPVTFAAAAGLGAPPGVRLLVAVGLAADRSDVSVEHTARNGCAGRADNDGVAPNGELCAGGPPTRTPPLAPALEAALRLEDVHAARSDDAGAFVCNALLYHSLAAAVPGFDAVFVHVPSLSPGDAQAVGRALGRAVRRVVSPA